MSRVRLEKLIVTQLLKKFPAFYGTPRFITLFTTARHWSLCWAIWIRSTTYHPISIHSNITFPSTPRSSELSPTFVITDQHFERIYHRSHERYVPRPSHHPWFNHPNNIWWSVQVMKLLIMESSPVFCLLCRNILFSILFSKSIKLFLSLNTYLLLF